MHAVCVSQDIHVSVLINDDSCSDSPLSLKYPNADAVFPSARYSNAFRYDLLMVCTTQTAYSLVCEVYVPPNPAANSS
jgi:hypothetical protein